MGQVAVGVAADQGVISGAQFGDSTLELGVAAVHQDPFTEVAVHHAVTFVVEAAVSIKAHHHHLTEALPKAGTTMADMAMAEDITKDLLVVVKVAVSIVVVHHVVAISTAAVAIEVADAVKIAAGDIIADKTERDPIRKMIFPS